MRVLVLADRLSERGGADVHLLGVLRELAPRVDLRLCVGRDDGTSSAPCPVRVVPGLGSLEDAPVDLDGASRRFRYDVVHVQNVMNPRALAWAASRPSLITVQDHRVFCPGRGKWTASSEPCRDAMGHDTCAPCFEDPAYFERILALTDQRLRAVRRMRVVVLSRYMRAELETVGVAPGRISVIPPFVHGLDPEAVPSGPPCVLFAGRVVAAKGVHDAVEAWRRSGVNLPLVFAGTGPLRGDLLAAGFEAPGWVSHEALAGYYRRAAALLFPPRWQEPFGITGLEALTLGTPVAAWRSGGVEEWHPGGDLLVPWGDVDALAEALRRAVTRSASSPPGFDPATLTDRLLVPYRRVASEE